MSQERWFGDFRSVGLVDWPEGLRDEVHHELTSVRSEYFRWAALAVLSAVVGVGLAIAVAITPSVHLLFAVPALALAMVAPGVAGHCGDDRRERWTSAKAALRGRQLDVFEAQGTPCDGSEPLPFVLIAPSRSILVLDSRHTELILQPCEDSIVTSNPVVHTAPSVP